MRDFVLGAFLENVFFGKAILIASKHGANKLQKRTKKLFCLNVKTKSLLVNI